jgi:hypothetical protein
MRFKKTIFLFTIVISSPILAEEKQIPNRWETKSQQEGITHLQRKAYEQIAQLHDFKGKQSNNFGTLDFFTREPNPMIILDEMGIPAIPFLVEALDDQTLTKTVTTRVNPINDVGRIRHEWKVNELVALLIRTISHREFVLGEWGRGANLARIDEYPDQIPEFQKLILEWYEKNKNATLEGQKIKDLESNLRNRLDAARWLGDKKTAKAVPFLEKSIDAVLARDKVSSETEWELAAYSLALGQIGDMKAFPAVKKACDRLSELCPRSVGSNAFSDLFAAYHGMALLGHKKEALEELNRIYKNLPTTSLPEMDVQKKKEYEGMLEKAEKW